MTTYYFDEQENKLIAYDTDAKALRELLPVSLAGSKPASEVSPPEPEQKASSPVARQRRDSRSIAKAGCGECGSLGRRHKKGCALAGGTAEASSKKMKGTPEWQALGEVTEPSKKMSRMNFGRVKISQSHDIPVETIARNLDENAEEIEKAFEADTYDDYQKL